MTTITIEDDTNGLIIRTVEGETWGEYLETFLQMLQGIGFRIEDPDVTVELVQAEHDKRMQEKYFTKKKSMRTKEECLTLYGELGELQIGTAIEVTYFGGCTETLHMLWANSSEFSTQEYDHVVYDFIESWRKI